MTPEQIKDRHYKLSVVDADSMLYLCAAAGTKVGYKLFNQDGELEGLFDSDKALKDHKSEVEDFFGLDTSEWVKEKIEEHRDLDYVIKIFEKKVKDLKKLIKADQWLFCIGEGELDRASVATIAEYKGARKNAPKPHFFYPLKDYVKHREEVKVVNKLEVDDYVSMVLYQDYLKNGSSPERILCYTDKDLDNTAGAKYNYGRDEFVFHTQEESDYIFAKQMITGDSTDNIKGLPKHGKVAAEKLLNEHQGKPLGELYKVVLEAYRSVYEQPYSYNSWQGQEMTKTAEDILDENCELLFMRRFPKQNWLSYKNEVLGL